MAGEKILEKALPDKSSAPLPQAEKMPSSENKIERILPMMEKPKEAPRPVEKLKEGGIGAPSRAVSFQSQRGQAIDTILSEGLNEIFLKMKPAEQQAFKKRGEETVAQINELLGKTKVKLSQIISLIRKWLKMIPGVNRFFLEQEVKIKADKIMALKDK